jgi:hypothetical protein
MRPATLLYVIFAMALPVVAQDVPVTLAVKLSPDSLQMHQSQAMRITLTNTAVGKTALLQPGDKGSTPDSVVGWYNGDPTDESVATHVNLNRFHVYDSFDVPDESWDITGAFANVWMSHASSAPKKVFWEIRRNCSIGNAGVVVASGTSKAVVIATKESARWGRGYKVTVSGLHVRLGHGQYWIAVAPVIKRGSRQEFVVGGTSGENSVGQSSGLPLYGS